MVESIGSIGHYDLVDILDTGYKAFRSENLICKMHQCI